MSKFIFTLASIIIFSLAANSHSGGTDSSGCHHDRKNGGYHCHHSDPKNESREVSSEDYEVVFNQKTKKIHRPGCKSAKSCTVNCINLMKSEALNRQGHACGNCGG